MFKVGDTIRYTETDEDSSATYTGPVTEVKEFQSHDEWSFKKKPSDPDYTFYEVTIGNWYTFEVGHPATNEEWEITNDSSGT